MKYLPLVVTLIGIAGASPKPEMALKPRANPDDLMIFTCNEMPEICTNMCYGAYCLNIGTRLQYDKASASEKRKRRKAAGCIESGGNRCSTKKGADPGLQCDEYPFASTVSTGDSRRVNRCVPAGQNSKQGGVINSFYRSSYCGGGPCDFTASFSNSGEVKYCDAYSDPDNLCGGDDNELVGPGGTANPGDDEVADDGTDNVPDGQEEPTTRRKRAPRQPIMVPRYRTSSGLEIMVPGGAHIGQRAHRVEPLNATLWDEQAATHVFDPDDEDGEFNYMLWNLVIREETVVAEIH